jgi:hypothetical protein
MAVSQWELVAPTRAESGLLRGFSRGWVHSRGPTGRLERHVNPIHKDARHWQRFCVDR